MAPELVPFPHFGFILRPNCHFGVDCHSGIRLFGVCGPNMNTRLHQALAALLIASCGAFAEASPTRWSFDAGWGVRLWDNADLSKSDRDYLEQARVGAVYALEVSAFPWKGWGFGFVHTNFSATASDSNKTFPDQSSGAARDVYHIDYTAPAVYATRSVGEKLRLVGSAGLGVLRYHDEADAGPFPGVMEGATWGAHTAGAVDVMVSKRVALGFGIRAMYGELRKFRYNAIETTTPTISLSRVDFGVGIRVYP